MAKLVWRPDRSAMRSFLSGGSGPAYKATKRVQTRTLAYARAASPVDTGNLKSSHVATPIVVSGQSVTAGVENTSKYALFVHEGTRAHRIVPRRAKMLAWIPRGAGKAVFAREVMHPGTRKNPWLGKAAELAARQEGFDWRGE